MLDTNTLKIMGDAFARMATMEVMGLLHGLVRAADDAAQAAAKQRTAADINVPVKVNGKKGKLYVIMDGIGGSFLQIVLEDTEYLRFYWCDLAAEILRPWACSPQSLMEILIQNWAAVEELTHKLRKFAEEVKADE